MRHIHERIYSECSKCGAEMLIGPLASFVPAVAGTGYSGDTLVYVHAVPLCDEVKDENASAWREMLRAAEDDAERAREATAAAVRERRAAVDTAVAGSARPGGTRTRPPKTPQE
jgi:predicted nucleic acid-binding Zn ribbon protein